MTDRISSFHTSPSTTFHLEADVVETQASYGSHGRWRVRFYLRANNGPGGTSGSFFGNSGVQIAYINRISIWEEVRRHSGNPFLPSGYADGAQRWRDGPTDEWVVANENGYWNGSSTSLPVRMDLDYGPVDTAETGSVPLPRIARAPGAPGSPVVSNVLDDRASFSWSAAARGNADITDYGLYISEDPSFATHVYNEWGGTGRSRTVTGLDPLTTYYARVRAQNSDGTGAYSATVSFTTAPDAPSAPTIGTPVRVSDAQQTVHWARVASSSAPYTSQQVQRRTYSGGWGAWTGVATLGTDYTSSGAQSWSDAGTAANRIYQYRVKASNSSGDATSGSSLLVYTTPGTPSSVVAEKTATGGVKLTIGHTVAHDNVDTEIEYSTNGGAAWTPLTEVSGAATTYTWGSPPTGDPLLFRVRVHVDDAGDVGNGLTSGWRTSNTVQLTAPPNAPSALDPNGVVYDATGERVFTWQHNPVDSSPQSKYQVRYRPVGGSWTTSAETASTSSEHSFAAGTFTNGVSYEWEARTWGLHATASPWSATAAFAASAAPVAAITSPEAEHSTSTLEVEWTFFDEEGTAQASWQAELVHDSTTVEARSGAGAATSTAFTTILTDATTYTVRVRVQDGAGLWSAWDEVEFTTAFDLPPAASIELTWNITDGSVDVTVGNPEAGVGEAEPDHNAVYRSVDGGETWVLLDDGVGLSSTFTDRTIPFGGEVQYKAVTWSSLPSAAESPIEAITPPATDVYWSAGAGFTTVVRAHAGLGDPPRVDVTSGLLTRNLHYFAGRTLPVEAAGTQQSRTGSVSFVTLEQSELATVRALSLLPAPHLVRAPDGTTVYCSVGPIGEERVMDGIYQISFAVSEVEQ